MNARIPLPPAPTPVPRLEPGDALSRDEFERRYEAMPAGTKFELIEGAVFMHAATRLGHHASPHARLIHWLCLYQGETPGTIVGDAASIRLDARSEPQPDAVLLIEPESGGQARISDDDYVEGSPELVAEISASTVSIDLHAKFRAYQQRGVCEYLVWRVADQCLDWFVLRENAYQLLGVDGSGILRSPTFPGLWLHVESLIQGDLRTVKKLVEQGTSSADHAAFIARLQATRDLHR